MNRATSSRALLWRLAKLHPRYSLAVALGVAALVAVVVAPRTDDRGEGEECRLEQTWFDGDIHYSQELVFSRDGNGAWSTGGGSDEAHKRVSFLWKNNGSTLTVVSDGSRRTVGYRIEPGKHMAEGLCLIRFDDQFLPDTQLSTSYSNRP